jgi:RNA polymerase sigma factor (sigma-70 family)
MIRPRRGIARVSRIQSLYEGSGVLTGEIRVALDAPRERESFASPWKSGPSGPRKPCEITMGFSPCSPCPLQYPHPLIRLHNWMNEAASAKYMAIERMALEQDQRISEVVKREQSRLRNFIRRRVPDPLDAEDILQDVFYRLVEANRLLMPIEHVTAWLFRVARNRITDLFRKKEPENFSEIEPVDEDDESLQFEDLLPSPDAGPEALYVRNVLLDELQRAVAALPKEQREVFVAHEFDGRSFKDLSAETGVSVNTLLSRKRYAVLHLRERLQRVYDEFTE